MILSDEEKAAILKELVKAYNMKDKQAALYYAHCLFLNMMNDKDIYEAYVKILNRKEN